MLDCPDKLKVIGLCGGSGAGKGEVCGILREHGIPCLDTDKVSRFVTKEGTPCLEELVHSFGAGILTDSGGLDRKALAEKVFSDEKKRRELNRITHFYITEYCVDWLCEMEKENNKYAVIDAPLLFESGLDKICFMTVGVISKRDMRIGRIVKRDRIPPELAARRIDSQIPDSILEKKCDFLIRNDDDIPSLRLKTEKLLKILQPAFHTASAGVVSGVSGIPVAELLIEHRKEICSVFNVCFRVV